MSSWIKEHTSLRKYVVSDPVFPVWEIQNEYQAFPCPKCGENIFCRLTHIWRYDINGKPYQEEYHNNYSKELEDLKNLLVTYSMDNIGIYEKLIDGQWKVMCDNKVIGMEIK